LHSLQALRAVHLAQYIGETVIANLEIGGRDLLALTMALT
jgi:hypothetical protein